MSFITRLRKYGTKAGVNIGRTTSGNFTTRTLQASDNARLLKLADGAQTATVPAGLETGFSVSFNNNLTIVAGTDVTITDKRTAGATNPVGSLVYVDVNTYEVWGTKS
jgi:hypothetical protein